ncbi:hypothetical protein [Desmospora profundinema]|uniref:Uncharacterized protein n=1 Tax=Desmospora profundinema TaxID=1571184 RepID=A0ABU1ILS8_9BACL|nr:hypothetical protein [Desmospora profundinema]MDR6225731.1 hypothetical protein [Desmospora profundinema]
MRGMACLDEEQVEQLIRCDCAGCRRRAREGEPPVWNWRRQVLEAVNRTLRDLFRTTGVPRTPWRVLQSLQRHWPANPSLFPDRNTYYTVWVKVTDHLMRYVVSNREEDPPILLMEPLSMRVEELGITCSIHVQLAQWSEEGVWIRRFLVDDHPGVIDSCRYLTALFAKRYWGEKRVNLEVVSLLNGDSRTFCLSDESTRHLYDYLLLVRERFFDRHTGYIPC